MGVYGFAWIPAIIYKVVCTRGQISGPRALCQVLAFHLYSFLFELWSNIPFTYNLGNYQACYNYELLIK